MVVVSQDKATRSHGGPEARPPAATRSTRPAGRLDHRAGAGHEGGHAGLIGSRPRRRRLDAITWGRARLIIAALVVAALAALIGGLDMALRAPAPGPRPDGPTLVVWRPPGEDATRISAVDTARWRAFVASRLEERARVRRSILEAARTEMTAGLAPVFQDMRGRVKDFIGWFYFFPTTYRMAFTGVISALSREKDDERSLERVATESLNRLLQDRFIEVVVTPERYGPIVDAQAREVLRHAIEREQAAGEAEIKALSTFMAANGRATEGERVPSGSVALSWEALGIPATASSMPAPPDAVAMIKGDPTLDPLQTTATTEGMMLVARQLTRRTVQLAISDVGHSTVAPMLAGALGPAEALLSPAVGIAAFAIGIGAEWGAIKARQMAEGERLTDLSVSVVDHLRDSQSRALSDAVVKRVETWLGG